MSTVVTSFNLNEEKLKLVNLVCASLFAEPRFNKSSDPRAQWICSLVDRVASKDPEFILKVALYVRDDLNIRSTANFMLALAANIPECGPFFKKYFHKAVRLPSDWLDVAALYMLLPDRKLKGNALPSALRKAMSAKFAQFDAYQLAKYNKQNSMKRKRKKAKELAEKMKAEGKRPPPIPEKKLTIKQVVRQLHISQPVPHVMCILGKKYPADMIAFRDSGLSGNFKEERAGKRMKLPVPETWETMISLKGNKAHVWEELIDNRKLPFMAMLRNLRNLIISGISNRHHRWVKSRLCDEKTVANSRQFPFSFFTAYEAIDIDLEQLKEDIANIDKPVEKVRGAPPMRKKKVIVPANMPTPQLIQEYKDALDTAVKFATVHNVKPIRGSTIVFCSVSDSMCSEALSGRSVGRVKSLVEVGILLGLMCKYMCEECDFRIVASPKKGGPAHMSVQLNEGTILDNMQVVMGQTNALGSGFEFPFDHLEGLIDSRKKIDNIIVLSDDTLAPGHNEMVGSGSAAGGISGILKKYRQEINPDLLYVNVNLKGSKRFVDDAIDESKIHPNDIVVSGFSDAILKYVAERGDGNQIEYIQHIDEAKNLDALASKLELRLNANRYTSSSSSFWSFVDSVQECKWEGCSSKVKKEKLGDHMKGCDYRVVSCDVEACGETFPYSQKDGHFARCFYRKMEKGDVKKWRNVRVFVSSTFLDMHGERDILSRYVFPEIKAYCAARKINFFYVDLRWGITEEDFKNGSAVDVCLNEVEKCRPFFIGLLGDRYGWVPPSLPTNDPRFSWVQEYEGRSITELEVISGCLLYPSSVVGSSVFIRDASFAKQVPDEYQESFVSSPEHKILLEDLKNRVRRSGNTYSYAARWGGVVDGKPVASRLEEFRRLVTDQLRKDIDATFPDDGEERSELHIEHDLHDQFLEARARRFVGRADLLKQLFKYADAPAGNFSPVVVHGAPGFGKSSVTARFCRTYAEQRPGAFILSHFVSASPHSSDIRFTLWRLCSELKEEYNIAENVPDSYKELKQVLPRFLEQAAFGRPCIVVIDSLHQFADDNNRAQSLEWLPSSSPIKIIVSCYTNTPAYTALRYKQPEFPCLEVGPLPEAERKDLVRFTLLEYRKKLEESPTNNQMRLLLRKSDSAKPLWLATACEELCLFGVYEKVSDEIKRLPASIPNLFGYVLQRLENDFGSSLVSDALCFLVSSRTGLTEVELLHLLGNEMDGPLPQAKWAELNRGLEAFLRSVGFGDQSTLDFTHDEIRFAIKKRYFKMKDRTRLIHTSLASYYQRAMNSAISSLNGPWSTEEIRAVSELPFHLLHSGQKDALESLLCDLRFLQTKVQMGMTYPLAGDLYEAVRGKGNDDSFFAFSSDDDDKKVLSPLEDCQRFITSNTYILARSPHLIFQQAANQPDSSIIARSAHAMWDEESTVTCTWLKWFNKPQEHDACKLTLAGHSEAMLACAFSPDGMSMVCASRDRTLKIFDVQSGTEKATLLGHTNWVVDCAYSNDGSTIVSASWDNSVRLWDGFIGSQIKLFKGHTRRVSACCFSNDSRWILSGSWDCSMKIWNPREGDRYVKEFKGHNKPISTVAFSPDDKRVVSASWDCTVRIWDVETQQCTSILQGHSNSIRSVAFAPNGREVVSTSSDCTIRVWDIKREKELALFSGHTKPVNSCAFSKDGKHLISASDDQTIKVWDALGGTEIQKMKVNDDSYGNGIAISNDGKFIATANSDCSVRVWNTLSGLEIFTLKGHTRCVNHVAISPSGKYIASASDDTFICVWNLSDGSLLTRLEGHQDTVHHVTFHPNNEELLLSASADFNMFEWNFLCNRVEKKFHGHTAAVMCCDYAPKRSRVLSSSKDGTLRLWNSESAEVKQVMRGHLDWITKCCFSPDGNRMASVSWDFNAIIWDARSGKELHTLRGHSGAVGGCAWGADSKSLVTSSFDSTLKLWNSVDGVLITTMEGHSQRVNHCAWSGNGDTMVSCGDDGTVRLWDAEAGAEITSFQGHSGTISSIAFSPDKSQVISASEDCTVKVWDANAKKECSGHADVVNDCAFSPDGKFVFSASRDESVKVWDVASNHVVSALTTEKEQLSSCDVSDSLVVAASNEGNIHVWNSSSFASMGAFSAHSSPITCVRIQDDVIATASWDSTIRMWNKNGSCQKTLLGHTDWVNACEFHPTSSSRLLSVSHDHSVRAWSNGHGTTLGEHKNWVLACHWSPCGSKAVSGSFDGSLKVWDVDRVRLLSEWNHHSSRVNDCQFSGDGNLLISTSHDRSVCVLDLKSSDVVTSFTLKGNGCCISSHGDRIAVGDTLGNLSLLALMQRP